MFWLSVNCGYTFTSRDIRCQIMSLPFPWSGARSMLDKATEKCCCFLEECNRFLSVPSLQLLLQVATVVEKPSKGVLSRVYTFGYSGRNTRVSTLLNDWVAWVRHSVLYSNFEYQKYDIKYSTQILSTKKYDIKYSTQMLGKPSKYYSGIEYRLGITSLLYLNFEYRKYDLEYSTLY